MKKFFGFNKLLASVAVLASVMIFQSCLDDDHFLCSWMTVRHCYLSI